MKTCLITKKYAYSTSVHQAATRGSANKANELDHTAKLVYEEGEHNLFLKLLIH